MYSHTHSVSILDSLFGKPPTMDEVGRSDCCCCVDGGSD